MFSLVSASLREAVVLPYLYVVTTLNTPLVCVSPLGVCVMRRHPPNITRGGGSAPSRGCNRALASRPSSEPARLLHRQHRPCCYPVLLGGLALSPTGDVGALLWVTGMDQKASWEGDRRGPAPIKGTWMSPSSTPCLCAVGFRDVQIVARGSVPWGPRVQLSAPTWTLCPCSRPMWVTDENVESSLENLFLQDFDEDFS